MIINEITLFLKGLPLGITAEQVGGFFWDRMGLSISPERINVKNHAQVASAYLHITSRGMADFLNLQVRDQMNGCTLVVEPFKLRGERNNEYKPEITAESFEEPVRLQQISRNGFRRI